MAERPRAPRNRTLSLSAVEVAELQPKLVLGSDFDPAAMCDLVITGDAFDLLPTLTPCSFDLLFADPPYNLSKSFGKETFREMRDDEYEEWLDSWLKLCRPLLKETASVYICGDWRSGAAIQRIGSKYLTLRNRITWEPTIRIGHLRCVPLIGKRRCSLEKKRQ